MKRKLLVWMAPALVGCTVLFLGLGTAQATKRTSASPVRVAAPSVHPNVGVGGMALAGTIVNYGNLNGQSIPAGISNVDTPVKLKCKNSLGCTYEGQMAVQQTDNTGAWATCLLIDGVTYAECQYQGTAVNNGLWVDVAVSGHIFLSHGVHTLQTQAYSTNGAAIAAYDCIYRVYNQ